MEYQKALYHLSILQILHSTITQHSSPDTSRSQMLVSDFKKFPFLWKPAFGISIFSTCSHDTANKLFHHSETVTLPQRAGRQCNFSSFCNCRRLVCHTLSHMQCAAPLCRTHTHSPGAVSGNYRNTLLGFFSLNNK